jgi:hypothetical protein
VRPFFSELEALAEAPEPISEYQFANNRPLSAGEQEERERAAPNTLYFQKPGAAPTAGVNGECGSKLEGANV